MEQKARELGNMIDRELQALFEARKAEFAKIIQREKNEKIRLDLAVFFTEVETELEKETERVDAVKKLFEVI